MADPQPPEAPNNGAVSIAAAATFAADSSATVAAATTSTVAAASAAGGETLVPGTKRQRRPSVRLGDIGEQPAAIPSEPHPRRNKQWKISSSASATGDHHSRHAPPPRDPSKPLSKTRPLTTLGPDEPRDAPADDRILLPCGLSASPAPPAEAALQAPPPRRGRVRLSGSSRSRLPGSSVAAKHRPPPPPGDLPPGLPRDRRHAPDLRATSAERPVVVLHERHRQRVRIHLRRPFPKSSSASAGAGRR